MQKVKIFSNGSMGYLEDAINKWLEDGDFTVTCISYKPIPNESNYSAMVLYEPSKAAKMKAALQEYHSEGIRISNGRP